MRFTINQLGVLLIMLMAATSCYAQDPVIDAESCQDATACQSNREGMEIAIGALSCNEENSCSSNTGEKLTVGEGACNVSLVQCTCMY